MATIDSNVTRELFTIDASAPCEEAARIMWDRKVGSVAVRSEGRIVGIVSERDLVGRVLARGISCSMPVGEVMRAELPVVTPQASDREVTDLMQVHFTRHLLVAKDGEIFGVVSMRDLIRLMLDEKEAFIEQLQRYIQG
jgi:signal-transduction protein with cAMP-binding, CBS, and nucleotidyltransferase domain